MRYIIIFIILSCVIFGAAELLKTMYDWTVKNIAGWKGKKCGKMKRPF